MDVSRPSRLVAVGTEDGLQPIILVNSLHIEESYLALSHCWGTVADMLRTTKAKTLLRSSRTRNHGIIYPEHFRMLFKSPVG